MKQTPRQVGVEEVADLIDEVERLRKIEAAAIKLKDCKGRYHSELYYNQLVNSLQK